jgi:hypothetical protein
MTADRKKKLYCDLLMVSLVQVTLACSRECFSFFYASLGAHVSTAWLLPIKQGMVAVARAIKFFFVHNSVYNSCSFDRMHDRLVPSLTQAISASLMPQVEGRFCLLSCALRRRCTIMISMCLLARSEHRAARHRPQQPSSAFPYERVCGPIQE